MKKVLIILYYWPPAGGPGVQRWLKFATYLPEFGIDPIIFKPENPAYPFTDSSFLEEVPRDLKVIQLPINEPYKSAQKISGSTTGSMSKGIISEPAKQSFTEKFMLFIRGNFFIPDARKNWIKPAVKYLSGVLLKHEIDTIITTGPPHSLHMIGLRLKKNLGINWIADFRDPWTTIGYHKKLRLLPLARHKHKRLEKQVLDHCDELIVTSKLTKAEFQQKTNTPISVITNGFEEVVSGGSELSDKFTICHTGSLLTERNPLNLWEALHELVKEHNIFRSKLELVLAGQVSDAIMSSLEYYGLSEFLNLRGYVDHDEVIKLQQSSQLLLLVEIDSEDTKCIIPGKLFEYLSAKRPIIGIGPSGSEIAEILDTTRGGLFFSHQERTDLKSHLLACFNAYQDGDLKIESKDLRRFHRRELSQQLAKLLSD